MEITEECPDCGGDYVAEFGFQQFGRGKILLKADVECEDCDNSGVYQKGLERV